MQYRESQFVNLIAELLGPRNGIDEVFHNNPLKDYVTGILQPADYNPKNDLPEHYWLPDYARSAETSSDHDGGDDDSEQELGFASKELSPLSLPKTIGISFFAKTDSVTFDLCATWSRYKCADKDADGKCTKWQREPHMRLEKGVTIKDEGLRDLASIDGVGIKSMSRKIAQGLHISVFIINYSKFSNRPKTDDHVFQPQLRINLHDESALREIDVRGKIDATEDLQNLLVYGNRPTLAKGHMCGAVWKEIDTERNFEDKVPTSLIPEDIKEDAFERAGYNKTESEHFVNPTLRTDFLPTYATKQSSANYDELGLDKKHLSSKHLADSFGSTDMTSGFEILSKKYMEWIASQGKTSEYQNLSDEMRNAADDNIKKCTEAADRIKAGIKTIEDNAEARLAFCFMNKAMYLQSEWKGRALEWRPFQMAFILQCIDGIVNKTSPDRKICDLLWFPTGGGKTEAYLGLLVFCLALRRLRNKDGSIYNYGTSVITRYTLRLLTIQQFRRTLSTITACEYLRCTDWNPTGDGKKLWGSMRFSIGMWLGNTVTPSGVTDRKYFDKAQNIHKRNFGAASILENPVVPSSPPNEEYVYEGEQPAQVMNCPCCNATLSIPKVGIDASGDHELFLTISSDKKPEMQQDLGTSDIKLTETPILYDLQAKNCYVLQLKFQTILGTSGDEKIWRWWNNVLKAKLGAKLECASPDKPGYFIINAPASGYSSGNPCDIETRCPNPGCSLNGTSWNEFITVDNKQIFSKIPDAFKIAGTNEAKGIPIPAFVTDSQIFSKCPSVIIGTVDKFARIPLEPKCASLFGNVDRFDDVWGFYRENAEPEYGPNQNNNPQPGNIYNVSGFAAPEMIIQDELHLIEGPLGSMTGLYESAIESLCTTDGTTPKYIASTATTKNAELQVSSLYCRPLRQFPPHAIRSSDNFYSKSHEAHQLDEEPAGRLYVGVCSPGKGAVSPPIRIWSSLLQNAENLKQKNGGIIDDELDFYWSVVGYFNATRELANFRSAYRADVKQWVTNIATRTNSNKRDLDEKNLVELQSNMADKKEISSVLDKLQKEQIDALLATSMFGTGVDIDRLSQMIVHGQPKTTSSYIQATGRVGRRRGAIVVTFLRSARPRDLDHYEFFTGYHRALNRFVEPITVFPFSPRAIDRGILPVFIAILRNARSVNGIPVPKEWYPEDRPSPKAINSGSRLMDDKAIQNKEIQQIISTLEQRNSLQPKYRKQETGYVTSTLEAILRQWSITRRNTSRSNERDLFYNEIAFAKLPQFSVVMGDDSHKQAENLRCVKDNTPQSMRNVESATKFKVES